MSVTEGKIKTSLGFKVFIIFYCYIMLDRIFSFGGVDHFLALTWITANATFYHVYGLVA